MLRNIFRECNFTLQRLSEKWMFKMKLENEFSLENEFVIYETYLFTTILKVENHHWISAFAVPF